MNDSLIDWLNQQRAKTNRAMQDPTKNVDYLGGKVIAYWEVINYMETNPTEIATLQNDIERKDQLLASANQLIEELRKQIVTLKQVQHEACD